MRVRGLEAGRDAPWRRSHDVALGVLLVAGLAAMLGGYWGTSGTLRLSRQVLWLNVAAAGLLIAGLAVVSYLAAGRRAVGRRRLGLFGDLPVAGIDVEASGATTGAELVAGEAMTRYHRADCAFVAGKVTAAAPVAAHERAGRRPCGVCLGPNQTRRPS